MNPAHLLVTVGLLLFASVALAGVEFRPLPAGLTVQVTSTTPRAIPTMQRWIVSNRTLTQADMVTVSAFVINCPACVVQLHICKNSDLTQCNYYSNSVYADGITLADIGDGWNNATLSVSTFRAVWPRGTYYLSVVVSTSGGQINSYTSAQLETLFGAGSVALTDWPALSTPLVTVDRFHISPNTVTTFNQLMAISIHFTGPVLVTYASIFFTTTGVGIVGGLHFDASPTDGWINVTLSLSNFDTDGAVQALPYMPYAFLALDGFDGYQRLLSDDFRTALGFMPTLTPTGPTFSTYHVAPHCNFTFTMGPLNVDSGAVTLPFNGVCDFTIRNALWFLAGPASMRFVGGGQQLANNVGASASVAQGAVAGTYSVYAVWVSDLNGNIAVYSDSQPPFPSSQWTAQAMGEAWPVNDELNRVFAALGEGTTSGAHRMRGPLALVSACVAFAAAVWRLL